MTQNAPYFNADDFRAFALGEHMHTIENEDIRAEFKEAVKNLVAGRMNTETDENMEIDWE